MNKIYLKIINVIYIIVAFIAVVNGVIAYHNSFDALFIFFLALGLLSVVMIDTIKKKIDDDICN